MGGGGGEKNYDNNNNKKRQSGLKQVGLKTEGGLREAHRMCEMYDSKKEEEGRQTRTKCAAMKAA